MKLCIRDQHLNLLNCTLLFISLNIIPLFIFSAPAPQANSETDPIKKTLIESYRYDMRPVGKRGAKKKRTVDVKYVHTSVGTHLSMNTRSKKKIETIHIFTDPFGQFVSGSKTIKKTSGKQKFHGVLWREGNKVYGKKITWHGWRKKEYTPHKGKSLAVDASLLLLLRHFQLDKQKKWHIYMVDFSHKSITITVQQKGIETVTVPAGTFACYRVDVAVNLIIFHPKITYWLSREKPHFLVKHKGMIGPFSKTYITRLELLSVQPGSAGTK
jgi:hypothetical protein